MTDNQKDENVNIQIVSIQKLNDPVTLNLCIPQLIKEIKFKYFNI